MITRHRHHASDEFNELVGAIYAGPLQSPPWHGALKALKTRFGASYIFLILRPPSPRERGMTISVGDEAYTETGYFESGYALDPFVNLPPNRVVTVDEMIGAKAWVEGEFYRTFVPPGGRMRYNLGADIHTEEGVECRLRICRPASSTDYTQDEKALCQLLLPHLARAVYYHARLDSAESERTLLASTVERMLVGTLIFDDRRKLMRMNRAAEAILAQKDGLELVRRELRVTYLPAENAELQQRLQTTIGDMARAPPAVIEAMCVTRPSGRQKLGLLVRTIPAGDWSEGRSRPVAAVFVRDPDYHAEGSASMLHQLFHLTPTESALAMHLANGLSLDEAAGKLTIRKNTARAHLRSVFAKVGVTSQTALVRVLLNSVIQLA